MNLFGSFTINMNKNVYDIITPLINIIIFKRQKCQGPKKEVIMAIGHITVIIVHMCTLGIN